MTSHIKWIEQWLDNYSKADLKDIFRRLFKGEITIETILRNELEGRE